MDKAIKLTKVFIGSDHAGFELKQILVEYLNSKKKFEIVDCGADNPKAPVDYPDYAKKVCDEVVKDDSLKGILVCGAGIGMSIAANKCHGIRCGLCHDYYTATMCREHNNCNVVAMGARVIGVDIAKQIVDTFLGTEFLKDHPNHLQRQRG